MKPKFVLVLFALMLVVISYTPVNAAQIDPFEVNDTRDLGEVRPGDGVCDNGDGGCSLRAAIEEANVFGPNNNVVIEVEIIASLGPFLLEKEITVAAEIILYGNGNTISGAEKTRLFNITEKGDFSLTNVTLSDGASDDVGGAISNAGSLQLEQCAFLSNEASKSGGAIYTMRGSKLLIFGGSEFSRNGAVYGGAIHNEGGYTLIIEGLLHQNFAVGDRGNGGAIYTDKEGITDISWSTLDDNSASFSGGLSKVEALIQALHFGCTIALYQITEPIGAVGCPVVTRTWRLEDLLSLETSLRNMVVAFTFLRFTRVKKLKTLSTAPLAATVLVKTEAVFI